MQINTTLDQSSLAQMKKLPNIITTPEKGFGNIVKCLKTGGKIFMAKLLRQEGDEYLIFETRNGMQLKTRIDVLICMVVVA